MWNKRIAAWVVLVASCAIPVLAVEGRVAVIGQSTITAPGSYIVTQDFSVPSGDGITISASDVTLDLNGHTITHAATAGANIRVSAGATLIRIRNGRLKGGDYGIIAAINNLAISIERMEVSDPLFSGFLISAGSGVVEIVSSVVRNTGNAGITVGNGSNPFTGRFVNNVVDGAALAGLFLSGCRGVEVVGNSISSQGNSGLSLGACTGSRVEGNFLSAASGVGASVIGIFLPSSAHNNLVLDNTIRGYPTGFRADSNGNRVAGNVIRGATDGIAIGGLRNLLEGNQVEGSGGCGLNFINIPGGANAYRNNMLRGNTGGAVCGFANTDAGGNIP